ncbi:hypothetical protein SMCF_3004, partial [Streptomyces coelicoflavus ZG0656]
GAAMIMVVLRVSNELETKPGLLASVNT